MALIAGSVGGYSYFSRSGTGALNPFSVVDAMA
jgi:hypothetical protein